VAATLKSREVVARDEFEQRTTALFQEIGQVESGLLQGAAVVATTLTRLYTTAALHDHRADAVILDEVSVASLPQCLIATAISTRRVVAFGDFMQLPTIVQSDHPQCRIWLGTNVFKSARADDPAGEHVLRAMLVEQYRMHPQISSLVSRTFYEGKLKDAAEVTAQSDAGPAILVVDSSEGRARSEPTRTGSKHNKVHAKLVAELVGRSATRDIAVITPYRAQVQLLRDRLRERHPELLESGDLEVFTVHRFQGRDKDLVIFDVADAPGTPCRFLDEVRNEHLRNLINVALSRAKTRLVIVAHVRHLQNTLGQESLLPRIVRQVRVDGGLERTYKDTEDRQDIINFLEGIPNADSDNSTVR